MGRSKAINRGKITPETTRDSSNASKNLTDDEVIINYQSPKQIRTRSGKRKTQANQNESIDVAPVPKVRKMKEKVKSKNNNQKGEQIQRGKDESNGENFTNSKCNKVNQSPMR